MRPLSGEPFFSAAFCTIPATTATARDVVQATAECPHTENREPAMKTEIITALMKTVAGTRPAPDRALIGNIVAVASAKAAQKNAAAVNEALTPYLYAPHRCR